MHNIFRPLHHLTFRNPQRRFCNRRGKIINFYAIKLRNRYLDGIIGYAHNNLPMLQQINDLAHINEAMRRLCADGTYPEKLWQ